MYRQPLKQIAYLINNQRTRVPRVRRKPNMVQFIFQRCLVPMLAFVGIVAGCNSAYDGKVINKERSALSGHQHRIRSLSFSPNGNKLASGSQDGTIKIWDTETWSIESTIQDKDEPASPVLSVAFAPNGNFLAAGKGNGETKLYRESGEPLATFQANKGWVRCVAFSPDSKQLASAEDDGSVIIWDTETGKPIKTLKGSDEAVWCVAFSPDGKSVASGGWETGVVRIWDVGSGREVLKLNGVRGIAWSLAFSGDGKTVATGGDFVWLHDPVTGAQRALLRGHVADSTSIAMSADGQFLVSAGGAGEIKVWDTASCKVLATYWGNPREELWSIALSPDGKTIVSGTAKGNMKVWDMVK
jgi:WD40 repeat protein